MKIQWRRPVPAMHLFAALLVWCGAGARVQAQEVGDLAWFQEQWDAAIEWEPPANTFFRYRAEGFSYVDRAEVAALEEEVRGHPEHPQRSRLDWLRQVLERGSPVVSQRRLWWAKRGWRFSRDTPQNISDPVHDVIVTDRVSWSLHQDSLGIADPRRPPKGQDYSNYVPTLQTHLAQFVNAELGLGANSGAGFRPTDVRIEGLRWIGVVTSKNGQRVKEFRGEVTSDGRAITITDTEFIVSKDAPRFEGSRIIFHDWAYSEHLGREIAMRVEGYDPRGRIEWRLVLEEVSAFPAAEFESLARVPKYGQSDVIRGTITPASVMDARPGAQQLTIRDETGTNTQPLQRELSSVDGSTVRVLGWVVAALGVAAVVWFSMRRRASEREGMR